MLSNWILHRRYIHWGNTCLFMPLTTCFTVTVNAIKDTQGESLILYQCATYAMYNFSTEKRHIHQGNTSTVNDKMYCLGD